VTAIGVFFNKRAIAAKERAAFIAAFELREELATFMREETVKWGRVIKTSGIKIDQ